MDRINVIPAKGDGLINIEGDQAMVCVINKVDIGWRVLSQVTLHMI